MIAFLLRTALYYLVLILVKIHPAVMVGFDRPGLFQWFVLLPLLMFWAWWKPKKPLSRTIRWGVPLVLVLIPLIFVFGWTLSGLSLVLTSAAAYLLTWGIFRGKSRILAVLEPFALPMILLRLLAFSRANPQITEQSEMINRVLLGGMVLLFLIHTFCLRAVIFPGCSIGRKERWIFPATGGALLMLFFLLFSPNVVENEQIENLLGDKIEPELLEGEGEEPSEGGGEDGLLSGEEGESDLYGVDGESWGDQRQQGGRQYAVMVVATPYEPLYSAGTYFSRLDPDNGFQQTREYLLNEMINRRLIETWINQPESFPRRSGVQAHFFSIDPERYLPYEPALVEPTIFSREYHPFDYRYTVISSVPTLKIEEIEGALGPSIQERLDLREFLEVNLYEDDEQRLREHLDSILSEEADYSRRILDIMNSFKEYQYNLVETEDARIPSLMKFLLETKEGDCTEFSNAAALLGRLAGIPSRVVTGYLVSSGLQTSSHREGLIHLRDQMPELNAYPLDQMYLVTTNHSHSWVQFYLPEYGWVDFEATDFAIPPPSNPNNMDVVIPVLRSLTFRERGIDIPWQALGGIVLWLAVFTLAGLYLHHILKGVYLYRRGMSNHPRAYRFYMRWLVMRMASEGCRVKKRTETPLEYAVEFPGMETAAQAYNRLRYRTRMDAGERSAAMEELTRAGRSALQSVRQRGLKAMLRRIFSLRGSLL